MAQAARLNLRMQKELKLLLTDPPPGASFPTLSDADSSLTSIDALLQGPEGTVYSNGVFKIKIQIPERYPFQPPIVTFATPIYHPNIDNGGRICLDILNLPPKGMWQPSLNISTILTSIGLLLSEPNPDDGLMHEASRDYKYNRQAFDHNARSMTEKYAQVGLTDIARSDDGSQVHVGQSTSQTRMEGSVASVSISEHMKLSLESPGCSNNRTEETSKAPVHTVAKNHIEIGPVKESSRDSSNYTWSFDKLRSTRYKLSPKFQVASHGRIDESENTRMSTQGSSALEIQTTKDFPESVQVGKMASNGHVEKERCISVGKKHQSSFGVRTEPSGGSDLELQSIPQCPVRSQEGLNKTNHPEDAIARKRNCSTSNRLKKRGLVGLKPSSESLGHPQNHLIDDKEKLPPLTDQKAVISSVTPESGMCNEAEKKTVISAPKLSETDVKLPLVGRNNNVISHPTNDGNEVCDEESANSFKQQETDLIVLDSEDSDDDNVPVRSKLSLAKRCLLRKRKLGFR